MRLGILDRHRIRLEAAQIRLWERGGWAVFLGRFAAFLRAVMPALAGMSRMPWRRFFIFNAAGRLVWGVGVVLAGYTTGNSYAQAAQRLGRPTPIADPSDLDSPAPDPIDPDNKPPPSPNPVDSAPDPTSRAG